MARSVDYRTGRGVDRWVGLFLCLVLFAFSRVRSALGRFSQPTMRATTPPQPGETPPAPQRILAIKFYGLGNIALLLPVLGALRRGFPDAQIDFLTLSDNRAFLERGNLVDTIFGVQVDSYWGLVSSFWNVLRAIRARRYELVIDFEQFIKLSTIVALLSGAPERIGFNTDGRRRGLLLTRRVVYTDSEHMTRIFMRVLRPLQIDTTPAATTVRIEPDEHRAIAERLSEHGFGESAFPRVAVHVGSGPNFYSVPLKRWPTEHFAEV